MNLLSLYLRREPTTAASVLRFPAATRAKLLDVVAYTSPKNADKGAIKARWPYYATATKPTRRNKRVTLNCFTWAAVWLPDKHA